MARGIAGVFRALALVSMGLMAITALIVAADPLRHYSELSKGTLAYYTVSLLGGVALAFCLLLTLRFPAQSSKGAIGATAAAVALVVNHVAGLRFQTILCFTPS